MDGNGFACELLLIRRRLPVRAVALYIESALDEGYSDLIEFCA